MEKTKHKEYLDGWVYIYKRKDNIDNRNIKSLNDLIYINRLAFCEKSARDEDIIFAESKGCSLNKKIKVTEVKFLKDKQFAKISDILYYVYRIDKDKSNKEIYLYLESVRDLSERQS